MANQQLLDYIKQRLGQGASIEQIRNSLQGSGWPEEEINKALSLVSNFALVSKTSAPQAVMSSMPGALDTLKQTITIYEKRIGTFLGIMVLPMLLSLVLPAVSYIGSFVTFSPEFMARGIGMSLLLAGLAFAILIFSQVWGQTALLYAIKDSEDEIGVMEAYRRGWRKILSYFWVSLLAGLITFGGFVLFIIPGIIFVVWFSLSIFVLFVEDINGMNALLKSREYVKGKWGDICWRLFFISVISLVVVLVSSLVFRFLKGLLGIDISGFVSGLFLSPLVMTYLFLVYNNLKVVKGEIAFTPTTGQKAIFIVIGATGITVVYSLLFLFRLLRDFH